MEEQVVYTITRAGIIKFCLDGNYLSNQTFIDFLTKNFGFSLKWPVKDCTKITIIKTPEEIDRYYTEADSSIKTIVGDFYDTMQVIDFSKTGGITFRAQ